MKINFTKKEYRSLVEILHIADWFVDAFTIGDDNKAHAEVRKKILSYYKEMGVEDVEYDSRLEDYYPTQKFDEYLHEQYIDKYDEESFWTTLIDRLAERDVVHEIGFDAYQKLDGIERISMVEDQKGRYFEEFEKNGLKHVKLIDVSYC